MTCRACGSAGVRTVAIVVLGGGAAPVIAPCSSCEEQLPAADPGRQTERAWAGFFSQIGAQLRAPEGHR